MIVSRSWEEAAQFFSKTMLAELPFVVLIVVVAIAGLWLSNVIYDRGVPQYISRKIGHGAGGMAFLLAFFFSSSVWPIILATAFSVMLLALRLVAPNSIRGVGGTGRSSKAIAEIWFSWVAIPVVLVAWLWLNKPEIAVTSLLFMAWGDGVTGLVRSRVYHKPVKGMWGSLAMLSVCLLISWFFIKPFWIGITASIVAVMVEWAFGDCGILKWRDDNWAIPLFSMGTMLGLTALTGNF